MNDFNALKAEAAQSWQRRLLLLTGEPEQNQARARAMAESVASSLWLGAGGIAPKDARHYLGQECELLVVDWHQGIHLDALGALAGCLRGGGVLVLLSPPLEILAAQSPLGAWLAAVLAGRTPKGTSQHVPLNGLSDDQQIALAAGLKVLTGHRGRPLVMTADRGRGKTATLGLLAAEALKAGRGPVWVTAPRFEALAPLFNFAERILDGAERRGQALYWQGQTIAFYPPDRLLAEQPEAALLLVDEAAAIPTGLLDRIAGHYKRLVLSTTLHGYEGSGRGFALRFLPRLKALYPGTQAVHLSEPVRWAAGCPVERDINQMLLLDAEPDPIAAGPVALHWLSGSELVARPAWLKAVMGLLVSAHYQTAPSDIQHWLTDDKVTFAVATSQDQVQGVMALVAEGGLDPALCEAVYLGKRRLKGHLVLQSLSAHLGIKEAPAFAGQRVMRIAVLNRRQGLGSWLLEELERRAKLLLVSFAADEELCRFWQRSGWQVLRLGSSIDAASGLPSVMMAKGLEDKSQALVAKAWARFTEILPWQPGLPAELINRLYQGAEAVALSDWDKRDLARLVAGGANLDTLQLPLWKLAWQAAAKGECPLLMRRWLAGEAFEKLGPRKAVLAEVRDWVAQRVP